jgi:ABC-2 type transport system ATP-binding protein
MAQRLRIAAALLGDPPVLLLDEPVAAGPAGDPLDRDLLQSLAAQGRVVFVSSHLISEIALMAEHLVVIGGRSCSPTPRSPGCRTAPRPWRTRSCN